MGLTAWRWRAARLCTYFWRFKTQPFGRWLATGISSPFVMERPFHGLEIAVDVSRTDTHRLLYLEGERFVAESKLLAHLLSPGMRVVDVGANIGYYALILSAEVGASGQVTCLEPDPDNRLELERNVSINQLKNVTVLPIAAGSEDTELSLCRGINATVVDEGGDIPIVVKRLDSLDLGRVDFIKIDVEGYECAVLEGAVEVIDRDRPAMFIEVHPDFVPSRDKLQWILDFLRSRYTRITAHREGHPPSAIGKAMRRYAGRHAVESGDAEAWVSAGISASSAPPFWLIAER